MSEIQVGVFRLIDPPPGQAEDIAKAIEAIDYPWWRTLRATWADPDGACLIKWDPQMQQGATGLFYGHKYDIVLGTRYANWEKNAPFVFAHEVGHFVDRATLRHPQRADLTSLMHSDLENSRWYGEEDPNNPGEPFVWSHQAEHNEDWTRRDKPYQLMLNEAYADLFVAAFAPTIWDGTAFAELRGGVRPKSVRFTHWTNDFDAVRHITLEREMTVYDDVPADHPHAENINRAAELGLMGGKADGTFDPNASLTRAQAATVMVRLHDRLQGEAVEPAPNLE